jgi:hypothetical protein
VLLGDLLPQVTPRIHRALAPPMRNVFPERMPFLRTIEDQVIYICQNRALSGPYLIAPGMLKCSIDKNVRSSFLFIYSIREREA